MSAARKILKVGTRSPLQSHKRSRAMCWTDAAEGYFLDMRARGLRPRTIDLHREQLRVIRSILDAIGAPAVTDGGTYPRFPDGIDPRRGAKGGRRTACGALAGERRAR